MLSSVHSCLASKGALNTTGRAGLGNSAADYTALATSLQERGLVVETTAVARLDWARNAAGLADPAWWRGTLSPRPTVDWCRPTLCSPIASYSASQGVAEGRSRREAQVPEAGPGVCGGSEAPLRGRARDADRALGGWLACARLPAGLWNRRYHAARHARRPAPAAAAGEQVRARTQALCLTQHGTAAVSGGRGAPACHRFADQTHGILTSISQSCPGCHHPELDYVTVAGKWIEGAGLLERGASVLQRVAGASYQQVCGRATVW